MIREAQEYDSEQVFNLIHSAFSNKAESDLVRQLISDEDVLVHLVVESSGAIIGNVVVSKVSLEPDIGLICGGVAPLSVLPDHQSLGIGSLLMKEVVRQSKQMGVDALFVLGNPSYYKRFGFNVSSLECDYSVEHFQELELTEDCLVNLNSKVTYARAFLSL